VIFPAALLLLAQAPPSPPPEALRSPSGLVSLVLQPGSGPARPAKDGLVIVHFQGWTLDGKAFADTHKDEVAPHLLMEILMPGMREGLLDMVAGERRRLWIPEALAFGGAQGRPAGTLVMELELLEVQARPTEAPPDVAMPPSDAEMLPSGLVSKVLRAGTGTLHPTHESSIQVHYTGWTTDGTMFDSSLMRRSPEFLRMADVIRGWVEGIQLMVAGERRRFWVPRKLAYDGAPGKPAGMLVFDVELLSFRK
jgi:FKBP-type peptidyl-prolyl cis-trans isomerase